jgi:hypothetical protein
LSLIDLLKEENLLVPGIIGAKEPFTNMKEYILHLNSHIEKQFNEINLRHE